MADKLISILKAITHEQDPLKIEINKTPEIIDIDTAVNGDLDRIAEIVGEPPRPKDENGDYLPNFDNVTYRANIKIRIQLNGSNGERENIITAVKRYTGATSVKITEGGASIIVEADGVTTQDSLQQVKDITGAGIGLYFIGAPADPFQYDNGLGYDLGHYADVLTIKGVK